MRWSLLTVLALAACDVLVGPGDSSPQYLAHIAGYHPDDPRISVEAGQRSVRVAIETYDPGTGCIAKGETYVQLNGMVADVVPYNQISTGGACLAIEPMLVHDTVIVFPQSGIATIRVRGINARAGEEPDLHPDTIVVERSIVIP